MESESDKILSMKGDQLVKKSYEIQMDWVRNGFLVPPLHFKRVVSLLQRGFDKNDIYRIGCDVAAGFTV